jgi:superfamily II DNA or RNA helicase
MSDTLQPASSKAGKQLYDYQTGAINDIFKRLEDHPARYNLLYQLPTGGGKTVIFSEIAKNIFRIPVRKC